MRKLLRHASRSRRKLWQHGSCVNLISWQNRRLEVTFGIPLRRKLRRQFKTISCLWTRRRRLGTKPYLVSRNIVGVCRCLLDHHARIRWTSWKDVDIIIVSGFAKSLRCNGCLIKQPNSYVLFVRCCLTNIHH